MWERSRSCSAAFGRWEPVGSQGQQFGGGGQIPVRVRRLDMTELSRQRRQAGLDVGPVAIPTEQGLDREGMSQVVDAGSTA